MSMFVVYNLIDNNQKLNNFLEQIKDEWDLVIDTEFRRVDSYYPELCLVQVATKDFAIAIDILAITDLEPLFIKLYAAKSTWIVHSGRQDLEALYFLSKRLPNKIFDTQIVANFLGYEHQISYQKLVQNLLGIELKKAYSRFDWRTRPLPENVMQYALDDVIYLEKLHQKLKNYQYLSFALEDCKSLLDESLYVIDVKHAYKKTKGIGKLSKIQQQLTINLSAYREEQAMVQNKPRRWIFDDKKLIAMVLGEIDINNEILQNLPNIKNIENIKITCIPITHAEKNQIKIIQKDFLQIAKQYNLAVELIASKKDILKYIRGDLTVSFNNGWRKLILKRSKNESS